MDGPGQDPASESIPLLLSLWEKSQRRLLCASPLASVVPACASSRELSRLPGRTEASTPSKSSGTAVQARGRGPVLIPSKQRAEF